LCAKGTGFGARCVEREDECTYFGEGCRKTAADNPVAPW